MIIHHHQHHYDCLQRASEQTNSGEFPKRRRRSGCLSYLAGNRLLNGRRPAKSCVQILSLTHFFSVAAERNSGRRTGEGSLTTLLCLFCGGGGGRAFEKK